MDERYNRIGVFSASALKMIACLFMLIDHVGLTFFPSEDIFRILGRLAFPLFAFFIAEGCRYSKHGLRRFLMIFSIGLVFLVFFLIYQGEIYGNIFLTFSVSIMLDNIIYNCKKYLFRGFKLIKMFICILIIAVSVSILYLLYNSMYFEYGFFGMLMPVLINVTNFKDINAPSAIKKLDNHFSKILLMALGAIFLSLTGRMGIIQFYCLLAIPFIMLYNGKPGCKKIKYLFYVFYPTHLIIIEAIALILDLIVK